MKSDTSDFTFNGSINGWNYSTRHSSVDGDFISNGIDREELALGISKTFPTGKQVTQELMI